MWKGERRPCPRTRTEEKAEEALAAFALKLDRTVREQAPAGWRGDYVRESKVKNALYPLLDRDREATTAVFEIVKNQPGY
jgi:type I restriction enzyme R subunit